MFISYVLFFFQIRLFVLFVHIKLGGSILPYLSTICSKVENLDLYIKLSLS